MPRIRFKDIILHESTILRQANYRPSDRHPAPIIVEFQKEITTGVICKIQFQQLRYAGPQFGPERDFEVLLSRVRLPNFSTGESRYVALEIDLPNLMWFKYKIKVGPTGRYWEFTDAESLRGQLIRAQVFLRDYGIKWLEDPFSMDLWAISAVERDTFHTMLTTVVAAELEAHGYKPRSIERFDLPVFVKPLPKGLYAILEFTQTRILNPSRFVLDVGLYRKPVDNPYEDQPAHYPGSIYDRLADLLRYKLGIGPSIIVEPGKLAQAAIDNPVGDQVTSLEANYWEYTEQLGLQSCMGDILDKLKRYGLPWLEGPYSKDLQPASSQY
jgi:hypothetical protein